MGAQIYNSDATRALVAGAGITGSDKAPSELADKALPVVDMTPDFHRVPNIIRSRVQTSSGAGAIYTTSSSRDFYLTGISVSFIKDATCDAASGEVAGISAPINGVTQTFLSLAGITLTAGTDSIQMNFDQPIKIDRASNILLNSTTFTVGVLVRCATLQGYEINPPII